MDMKKDKEVWKKIQAHSASCTEIASNYPEKPDSSDKDWSVFNEYLYEIEDSCNSLLMAISSLRKVYGMKSRYEK